MPQQFRHHLEQFGLDDKFMVIGTVAFGNLARKIQLIEIIRLKADRKSFDRLSRQPAHQGHNCAGIQPAAQERPQRHVTDQPPLHGIRHQLAELCHRFILAHLALLAVGDIPVALNFYLPLFSQQIMGRAQLANGFVYRKRTGNVHHGHVQIQRFIIQLGGYTRMFAQRFDLGSKYHTTRQHRINQRFFAQPVACQQQTLPGRIPDRQRKHTIEMLQAIHAVLFVEVDNHLSICASFETMTAQQ